MNENQNLSLARVDQAQPPELFSAFGSIQGFEAAQRMAKALCSSSIVPENYRGEQNLGNCVIALEISNRIGANVLAVCQNLYLVHGKPGWSSQFLISCVNASRKFTPLRYRMTGEKGKDSWGCIAWATDKTGEVLESPEVTIEMAKAEGWYSKNGSKWKTMPELMLRYRTATLFARLYAPELTMGIQTTEELGDIIDVEATPVAPAVKAPAFNDFPAPPETPRATRKKKEPAVEPAVVPVTSESVPAPLDAAPVQNPTQPEDLSASFEHQVDGEPEAIVALRRSIEAAGIDEKPSVAVAKVVAWCVAKKAMKVDSAGNPPPAPTLTDIRDEKVPVLKKLLDDKNTKVLAEIKAMPAS